MKIHHRPSHWLLVALVLAALLLTLTEVHGQSTGAGALFEGRPALAGAQAGLGAQAGPPQGGIGVQGSEAAQRQLRLRRPSGLDEMPRVAENAEGAAGPREEAPPALESPVQRAERRIPHKPATAR